MSIEKIIVDAVTEHRIEETGEALDGTYDPVGVVAIFLKLLSFSEVSEVARERLSAEEKRLIGDFCPGTRVIRRSGVKWPLRQ